MKKLTVLILTVATLLSTVTPAYAGAVTATHPVTGQTKTIKTEESSVNFESVEKASEFNGKYYPIGYWIDKVAGEGAFLNGYKEQLSKNINNGNYTAYASDILGMNYSIDADTYLYENVTKGILDRYPVLVNGTEEQKTKRQLEQLEAYLVWLKDRTTYADSDNIDLDGYTFDGLKATGNDRTEKLGDYSWDKIVDTKSAEAFAQAWSAENKSYLSKSYVNISSSNRMQGVCYDYAVLTASVLQQMGINTVNLKTYQTSVFLNHEWNLVQFANGGIFHLDTTNIDRYGIQVFQATNAIFNKKSLYNDTDSSVKRYDSSLTTSHDIYSDTDANFILELSSVATAVVYPQGDIVKVFGTVDATKSWIEKMKNVLN